MRLPYSNVVNLGELPSELTQFWLAQVPREGEPLQITHVTLAVKSNIPADPNSYWNFLIGKLDDIGQFTAINKIFLQDGLSPVPQRTKLIVPVVASPGDIIAARVYPSGVPAGLDRLSVAIEGAMLIERITNGL